MSTSVEERTTIEMPSYVLSNVGEFQIKRFENNDYIKYNARELPISGTGPYVCKIYNDTKDIVVDSIFSGDRDNNVFVKVFIYNDIINGIQEQKCFGINSNDYCIGSGIDSEMTPSLVTKFIDLYNNVCYKINQIISEDLEDKPIRIEKCCYALNLDSLY